MLRTGQSILLLCFCSVFQAGPAVAVAQLDEAESVSAYLDDLGLDDLLLKHLEDRFESATDPAQREEVARRLADLYSEKLLSTQLSREELSRRRLLAKQLFDRSPGLESPGLRIAMSHAWHQEVQRGFQDWWMKGSDPAKRAEIVEQWRLLIRELLRLKRENDKRRNELTNSIDLNEDAGELLRRRMLENENARLQTVYLLGWSCYYRSITDLQQPGQWLDLSEENFRLFLQIPASKPLAELTVDWFDFESPWTVRAVIGLAMCAASRNQIEASERLFEFALNSDDDQIAATMPAWRLSSAAFSSRYDTAAGLAESYQPRRDIQAQFSFHILCVRTANAIRDRNPKASARLFSSGLAALVRLQNPEVIEQVLADVDPSLLESADGFYRYWVRGFLKSGQVQISGDQEFLEKVQRDLERAISSADSRTSADDVARCQYSLGWTFYQQREFGVSAGLFESVASQLRESDRELAMEAHWWQIQSLVQVSRRDARRTAQAFAAMDRMLNWFPAGRYSRRIEFEKLLLECRGLPQGEAMRRLRSVDVADEDYHRALYEMVGVQFEIWLESRRNNAATSPLLLERLEQLERGFRARPEPTAERKLKAVLLVVDAHLKSGSADSDPVLDSLLQVAGEFAGPLVEPPAFSYVEYRYYRFLYALRQHKAGVRSGSGDRLANLKDDAQWLVTRAKETAFEHAPLFFLAEQAGTEVDKEAILNRILDGDQPPEDPAVKSAIGVYHRLVEIYGTSDEDLKGSANARIAAARLAELYYFDGRRELSGELNGRLLALWPDRRDFLVQTGRVLMGSGSYSEARAIWRRMVSNVESGSPLWYEAKYNLARCLAKENPEEAGKLLRQTIRLSPDMPAHWKARFDNLGDATEQ